MTAQLAETAGWPGISSASYDEIIRKLKRRQAHERKIGDGDGTGTPVYSLD
jgi:hypothetical protein